VTGDSGDWNNDGDNDNDDDDDVRVQSTGLGKPASQVG